MAAAFHGNLDTVRHLLSLGAKASLADAGGKSAALIAGMRGHHECFAELQRAADEERAAGSRKTSGREDFVYDLYYFEPPAPRSPAARGGETVFEGQADDVAAASPGKIGEKVGSFFHVYGLLVSNAIARIPQTYAAVMWLFHVLFPDSRTSLLVGGYYIPGAPEYHTSKRARNIARPSSGTRRMLPSVFLCFWCTTRRICPCYAWPPTPTPPLDT